MVENGADEESEEEGDVYLARPGRSIAEAPVEKGSASTIFQSKIYGKTYDKESSEEPVSKWYFKMGNFVDRLNICFNETRVTISRWCLLSHSTTR